MWLWGVIHCMMLIFRSLLRTMRPPTAPSISLNRELLVPGLLQMCFFRHYFDFLLNSRNPIIYHTACIHILRTYSLDLADLEKLLNVSPCTLVNLMHRARYSSEDMQHNTFGVCLSQIIQTITERHDAISWDIETLRYY